MWGGGGGGRGARENAEGVKKKNNRTFNCCPCFVILVRQISAKCIYQLPATKAVIPTFRCTGEHRAHTALSFPVCRQTVFL